MKRTSVILATLGFSSLLSGCVAAVLPLAALGTMGKTQIDRAKAKQELVASGAVDIAASGPLAKTQAGTSASGPAEDGYTGQGGLDVAVSGTLTDEARAYLSRYFKPVDPGQPKPYAAFSSYALAQSARLEAGEGVSSAVLIPRVDIFKPQTVDCAGKPLAVLIDLDDDKQNQWLEADTLYRQHGLVETLNDLRASKISVIWVSDQPSAASDRISGILSDAGLSVPEADDFLFLDRGGDDRKQSRRWDAARTYCIVAIAGDKRSDFDELYDYLRDPDGAITLEHMFGSGWFVAPAPLVAAPDDVPGEAADTTNPEQQGEG